MLLRSHAYSRWPSVREAPRCSTSIYNERGTALGKVQERSKTPRCIAYCVTLVCVCGAALCVLPQLQRSDDKLLGTRLALKLSTSCGGECLVSRPPDLPLWKGGPMYPRARMDTVEKTLT